MENKKVTYRGYVPTDKKQFADDKIEVLQKAQTEVHWLLDKDYPIKNAIDFVCNHYMLSTRQRLALLRATAPTLAVKKRKEKEVFNCTNKTIHIDGFNLIITLEVALSQSTIIKCMDGTIRDLAEIRGTYRVIDKTDKAVELIGNKLNDMNIAEVIFYLDSQVSNTGRLKKKIFEILNIFNYEVSVKVINNVDFILKEKDYVVTTDAIILNKCVSWINLASDIISKDICDSKYINLKAMV